MTERVQRILQGLEGLDVTLGDRARQRCRLEQVMGMGAVQGPLADFADAVARPANALQGGGNGRRRLHQHHFVEMADVDAHFQ